MLTYATVKEYNRFIEELPGITHSSGDLKNVQRPWVVDAILKHVPEGGAVLELGADKCELADFLHKQGFEVWVIDAFDQFGGGTAKFNTVKETFPDLKVFQGFLHEDTLLPERYFDAVYSCSVVEHIPKAQVAQTCQRMFQCLKIGGYSIHAIDYTVRGIMKNQSLLEEFVRCHNVQCDFTGFESSLLEDVDTYFLSPQGHYRWRQFLGRRYDEYPYRKVTSLNLIAKNE